MIQAEVDGCVPGHRHRVAEWSSLLGRVQSWWGSELAHFPAVGPGQQKATGTLPECPPRPCQAAAGPSASHVLTWPLHPWPHVTSVSPKQSDRPGDSPAPLSCSNFRVAAAGHASVPAEVTGLSSSPRLCDFLSRVPHGSDPMAAGGDRPRWLWVQRAAAGRLGPERHVTGR